METKTEVLELEFRKFNFSEALSEETNAFSSDLYINNVFIGKVFNHGIGGDTEFKPSGKGTELIQEFIDQQSPNIYNQDKLIFAVDQLILGEIINYSYKKYYNRNLIFYNETNGKIAKIPMKYTIKELLVHPKDREFLKNLILTYQARYGKCMNRNIEEIKSGK